LFKKRQVDQELHSKFLDTVISVMGTPCVLKSDIRKSIFSIIHFLASLTDNINSSSIDTKLINLIYEEEEKVIDGVVEFI